MIITLIFEKNANFLRRKLPKIAENCDHNIDPRVVFLKEKNGGKTNRSVSVPFFRAGGFVTFERWLNLRFSVTF
jgi:hypothetical protein